MDKGIACVHIVSFGVLPVKETIEEPMAEEV